MEEKKYPIKWEYKSHSYQIGDTGDYDGYWEVTNGRDSLLTKDDYEDIEKDLQQLADLLNNTYANFKVDRGNEAALEAENKLLIHELEELRKAQPRAVWVKASEFKTSEPLYRPYRRKRNNDNEEPYDYGEIYVTEDNGDIFFDVNNERLFEPQTYECWKDYEILDESGTAAAGREEDAVSKEVIDFIRDVASNWDCDEDGHKYNTGCRKCSASELLYGLTKQQKEK